MAIITKSDCMIIRIITEQPASRAAFKFRLQLFFPSLGAAWEIFMLPILELIGPVSEIGEDP